MAHTTSAEVAATKPAIESDLGWALGTLFRAYMREAAEAVAELPGGPRAFQVLSIVSANSCQNQAAIAEQLGLDRTAVTYLIDDLEAQKLVLRRADPVDRRARRVTITAKGAGSLAQFTERIKAVERHLLAELSDYEAEQLRIALGTAARTAEANSAGESVCQIGESLGLPA